MWLFLGLLLIPHVVVETQTGPRCMVAASAAVSRHAGVSLTEAELAQHTRIFADGTSLFEVQRALEGRGLQTLVAGLSDRELSALLRAGLPVVLNLSLSKDSAHTVVLVGFDGPEEAPTHWMVLDPRDGQEHRWEVGTVDRAAVAHGGMVVRQTGLQEALIAADVDAADLRQRDHAQRAHGWYRLAMEHDGPTRGQKTLLDKALSYDPGHAGARRALAAHP